MLSGWLSNPRGIDRYRTWLGPRYATLRFVFDEFRRIGGRMIVELGTSRSFVSGNRRGCLSPDPRHWRPNRPRLWDWGAGLFTRMCAEELWDHGPDIHTVDISEDALSISRVITAGFSELIRFHHACSEAFLQTFDGPVDLLYMDTGETGQGADELHLREARIAIARNLFSPRALVLIDDVCIPGTQASKGRYSIPFLRSAGFEVRMSAYQAVLQRTSG